MALITQARILINAVNSEKISPDTIIPADIDETVAYNFSNASSTYDGIFVGTGSSASTFNGIVGSSATIQGIMDATSTFQGIADSGATMLGIITASATIEGILNDTNASSTLSGIILPAGSTANFIQAGVGTVGAAEDSTVVFDSVMSAAPKVFVSNSSTAVPILVKSASAAVFVVSVDTASTFNYLAVANSG